MNINCSKVKVLLPSQRSFILVSGNFKSRNYKSHNSNCPCRAPGTIHARLTSEVLQSRTPSICCIACLIRHCTNLRQLLGARRPHAHKFKQAVLAYTQACTFGPALQACNKDQYRECMQSRVDKGDKTCKVGALRMPTFLSSNMLIIESVISDEGRKNFQRILIGSSANCEFHRYCR